MTLDINISPAAGGVIVWVAFWTWLSINTICDAWAKGKKHENNR